jgi:hypothetical protein
MTMTRPRLIVISVIAIVLLYAAGTWVSNRTEWVEHSMPMPLKGEAARNPFYAAQRFADRLGATTSWDRIFTAPPADAVIVLTSWQWNLSASRRTAFERWVERGGRLVVDSTLFGGGEQFEKWSGITRKFVLPDQKDDADEQDLESEQEDEEDSIRPCREATEERDGAPVSTQRSLSRTVCIAGGFGMLVADRPVLWGLRDQRGLQVARVSVGRGSVTVINGAPFRSRALFDGDHAWLLVASTQMTRGDEIHFLSQDDHPGLLAIAWISGWPVIVLCGLLVVLLLWRGAMRFGPLAAPPALARRSLAEQIRGTGQFVLRGGGASALHGAMVRALEEAVRRNVKGYGALSGEARTSALAAAVGDRGRAEAVAVAMDDGARTDASDSRRTLAKIEAARRHVIGEDRKSSRKSWGTRR